MTMETLYQAIIKNKKYRAITRAVIERAIHCYFIRHANRKIYLEKQKSAKFKAIVQAIRGELHQIHGTFQTTKKHKREQYLQALKQLIRGKTGSSERLLELHKKILATNRSTKERLPFYDIVYTAIFQYVGRPKTVLDLGCGLNPVSYPFMRLETVTYFCYDIDEHDIHFLQSYFDCISSLRGTATVLDLAQIDMVKKLPSVDVAFLFNVLDPLERGKKGHKASEALIQAIPSRWLIVSFSTQTVSGKQMNYPYRGWMERMLTRLQFSFTTFTTENEFFYIIRKVG